MNSILFCISYSENFYSIYQNVSNTLLTQGVILYWQSVPNEMCGACRDWGQGWLKSERKLSIKIGLFIQEPTYWIKHTIFTRLFVQDILHHHEERTYISIKSFDIQRSSVQKTWLYFTIRSIFILLSEVFHKPAGKVVIKVTHCTTHHQMIFSCPHLLWSWGKKL